MTFNKDLAERALANIEADPQSWDQENWRCGTACCFAGHVALAAGWEWVNPDNPANSLMTKNGWTRQAEDASDLELGFPEDGGWRTYLYSGGNTLEDLRNLVEKLSDPETWEEITSELQR